MKQETIDRIRKFTEDRDWDQFHSPANLAKSIVIEAAELLECFQWSDEEYDLQHIKEELADVMVYSQNLLDKLGLDADEIINMKMSQNEAKYPVDKARGSAAKYDQLQNLKGGEYMQLPCSEELNIEYLGRLFDNTSECYKFFWFKAIVAKVTEGKQEM